MAKLNPENPNVKIVLGILAEVGLKHSMLLGQSIILEGGVDSMKACRIPAFAKEVTDEKGMIGRDTVARGILKGRRALLAHIVAKLVDEHGAIIRTKDLCHAPTVDEVYEMTLDDTEFSLCLMP